MTTKPIPDCRTALETGALWPILEVRREFSLSIQQPGKEGIMANITRRDPFAVDNLFDDLMKGFFVRPVQYQGEDVPVQIKMDVKEDDKSYTVHAEMPGVSKDDIHVHVEGNSVSIGAEVKKETERKEGEKVIHSERYYGKVYRSFTLGQEVDDANARAKFDNGVLELVLPKKAATTARRLNIE
jgi:HSP20 family protein